MLAVESRKPWVLRDSKRKSIFLPKLLQLPHNTLTDTRYNLPQQTVHTRLEDIQLVLNRKVDEVGIDQNSVGRS
jgi:hypothetical protein